MKKSFVILLLLALPLLAYADDPVGNSCYTENASVDKGSSFAVKVMLDNVDTLIAIQVPISYRSEDVDIVCDSVSFQGTRLQDQSLSFGKIDPDVKVAFFAYMAMTQIDPSKPMLNPGKGPIAVLWFTAQKDSKPGKVELVSGPHTYLPHEWIDYSYHFWTKSEGEQLTRDVECEYKPGSVSVK